MQVGKKSAPNFSMIKGYYIAAYPKKEDFVKNMAKWLSHPNKKDAKLKDAIKKYKQVMPYLGIDYEILKEIASYLYDTDEF